MSKSVRGRVCWVECVEVWFVVCSESGREGERALEGRIQQLFAASVNFHLCVYFLVCPAGSFPLMYVVERNKNKNKNRPRARGPYPSQSRTQATVSLSLNSCCFVLQPFT